jgi:hypothetical protein
MSCTLFQDLEHGGRIVDLRFGDQQVKMFGHYYVADQGEAIDVSYLVQCF